MSAGSERLRVAIIGLGDIAQRVYLPLFAARGELELVFVTRNEATLARLAGQYRPSAAYTGLDAALGGGLDAAFVHAATEAHPQLVRALLDAGVPTYVDKPLADTLAEAEALAALARARNTPLMVGFNRRFAPGYAELVGRPPDLILMQKNRIGLADEPRRVIFDDFIHVLDTLRFLQTGPVARMEVAAKIEGGLLHHVVVHLMGEGWAATGLMNRMSGANEEALEVMGGGAKRRVVNLAEVIDYAGAETLHRRGDWTPVARQRGLEQAVDFFVQAVRAGRMLDAAEAVETHRLCEEVLSRVPSSLAGEGGRGAAG